MHICFVEFGYPRPSGAVGGAGTYVQIFSRQLIKMGHDVSVLCGDMENSITSFRDGEILVFPMKKSYLGYIPYFMNKIPIIKNFSRLFLYLIGGLSIHCTLRKVDKLKKIDLIEYTEGGDFWNTITRKFRYTTHLHGSPYTFKKNSGQIITRSDWLHRKAEHFFINRAEKIVSPSQSMVELVQNEMGKKLSSYVIPYPIDQKQNTRKIIYKNKIEKSKVMLFFASRNDPVKGGDLFIDALNELTDKLQSKIKVEFFGYYPNQDVSNLDFITINKFVPRNLLMKAYEKTDICVIPSYFDNSPNTIYEAMAAGKIVVASSVGGIPEIVGGPENGFLFDPLDLNDFVDKITKAIKSVLMANDKMMRQKSRNRILSLANTDKNTDERLRLILG